MQNNNIFLMLSADNSTIIDLKNNDTPQTESQTGTGTPTDTPVTPALTTGESMMQLLLSFGLLPIMLVAFWFFMIRPQRKREKQMEEMQGSMKVGENVLTSAGFYGKIVSVGHDSFIVEFGGEGGGRGVRVPVRKADVVAIKTPVMTPPPVETAADKPSKKKKKDAE